MARPSDDGRSTALSSSSKHDDNNKNKEDLSLVEYFGSDKGFCGYCKKSPKQSGAGKQSHHMNTYRLLVTDYQDMLDSNWRRSGNCCYNPINQMTCCPNYPMICKALSYILTRSQRKCIEAVNLYLLTGDPKSKLKLDYSAKADLLSREEKITGAVKPFEEIKLSSKAKARRFVRACERKARLNGISIDEAIHQVRERWNNCRKPNLTLEEYLYPSVDVFEKSGMNQFNAKHNLVVELLHVDSKRSQDIRESEHALMVRYQRKIHNETSKEWDMSRYCDFLVVTPLVTEPLTNYDHLQQADDACDKLVVDVDANNASRYPLIRSPALPTAYGTYHCCYHLDGKLIAVGVLDVLPKCLTTVYFFYDPDYAFLNLGTYSALTEISMVRQLNKHVVDRSLGNPLTDYYLGFYVHESKKMHYKTKFKPSFILCSRTHRYVPTEICLEKLKDRKYADFADGTDEMAVSDSEFDMKELLQINIEPPVDLPDHHELTTYLASLQYNLGSKYTELFVNGWLIPYAKIIGDKLLPRLRLKVEGIHRHLLRRHERVTG